MTTTSLPAHRLGRRTHATMNTYADAGCCTAMLHTFGRLAIRRRRTIKPIIVIRHAIAPGVATLPRWSIHR
jgi:hypothetical protein